MSIEAMVEELVEKRMRDAVEAFEKYGQWDNSNVNVALHEIIKEEVEKKINEREVEFRKVIRDRVDNMELDVQFSDNRVYARLQDKES